MVGYRGLRAHMPKLHLEDETPAKKKSDNKYLRILLGIGVLVAVPTIGSTLAASISLNSGNAVQFGQGVVQATACDSGVTVTPSSAFTNEAGAGNFKLSSISISDIDAACDGKVFTIKVYDNSNSTALTVASPSPTPNGATATAISVTFDKDSTYSTIVGNTNATITNVASGTATSFVVNVATTLASTSVYKITVETS